MRCTPRLVALAATCVLAGGCTLLLGERPDQCRSHADCQSIDARYVCASDGVCVALQPDGGAIAALARSQCRRDADCASTAGLALCRGGVCLPLNDEALGCVSTRWGTTTPSDGSDVLPIGVLVSADELDSDRPRRRIAAAVGLAVEDFNRARRELGLAQLPALVAVACDEARPEALEYLLDALRVHLIVGPTDPSRVTAVLAQAQGDTLWIPPIADGPNLEAAVSQSPAALLSCRPNRASVRPYLLNAVGEARRLVATITNSEVDSIVPGLAVSGDAATTSFANSIDDGQLQAAGVRRVPYIVEPGGRGLVNALAAAEPAVNLVVAASAEDAWEENIPAVDGATYARQATYPYYLLADKRSAVLQAVLRDQVTADGFPRQYLRVLGLDYARSDLSRQLFADFESAFSAETQSSPEPGLEYVYDCTYATVYAAVAASARLLQPIDQLRPEAILLGLRALQGGGTAQPVAAFNIPAVLATIDATRGGDAALDLIGASGTLDFVLEGEEFVPVAPKRYTSLSPPGGELYCIDARRQTVCDTGVVFPPGGGEPSRPAAERCECLREVK
jgi:hypothetical protein